MNPSPLHPHLKQLPLTPVLAVILRITALDYPYRYLQALFLVTQL